jgi:hypothetical protein
VTRTKADDASKILQQQAEHRRIRLLYSLGDLQLALSASTFLAECDPDEKYSRIEMRRFRCFETALITAYARPFSQSKGTIPSLSFKMAELTLTEEQMALHRRLMRMRNKVIAHSDREMMRVTTKAHRLELGDDKRVVLVETVFDEGITLLGDLLVETDGLLHLVYRAVSDRLHAEAQLAPNLFDVRIDYLQESS